MVASKSTVRTKVDGHVLQLSNLEKVLYPDTGFTKGEVIDYYMRVSPYLLPHLANRPLTRKRWPDGVESQPFFEKNAPRGTPNWVRTVVVPSPGSTRGSEEVNYIVANDLATLVWLANLAALELHVFQWQVGPRGAIKDPDLLVVDLDPGPPANVVDCCKVALLLREVLAEDNLKAWAKTSGSKGMQLYVPIKPTPSERTSGYMKELAERLAKDYPKLVVAKMAKQIRPGKVFLDWSQNNAAKTTVAPYSLRGKNAPTVSTPVTWEEVEECRKVADLTFRSDDVLDRVEEFGDLMAELGSVRQPFP